MIGRQRRAPGTTSTSTTACSGATSRTCYFGVQPGRGSSRPVDATPRDIGCAAPRVLRHSLPRDTARRSVPWNCARPGTTSRIWAASRRCSSGRPRSHTRGGRDSSRFGVVVQLVHSPCVYFLRGIASTLTPFLACCLLWLPREPHRQWTVYGESPCITSSCRAGHGSSCHRLELCGLRKGGRCVLRAQPFTVRPRRR